MKYFLLLSFCFFSVPAFAQETSKASTLLRQTDTISKKVSTSRGLLQKSPLLKEPITQEKVRQKLLESLAEETEPGELEAEALFLKKLGLVPVSQDYKQVILDLLTEQIAGFYDSEDKTLYIVEEVSPEPSALAHEIGHALQDQHFNLKNLHDTWEKKGSDAQLALSALIEGDAMGMMLDFQLNNKISFSTIPDLPKRIREQAPSEDPQSQTLNNAPAILRETLIFPYTEGLAFVYQLRQQGPWSVIDKAFSDPPQSTEQILHPEKYYQEVDRPSEVPLFSLQSLEKTHQRVHDDIFGELQWRIYFQQTLSIAEAKQAAAGWDGDRLILLAPRKIPAKDLRSEHLDASLVAIISTWDTQDDAEEAKTAMEKVVLDRYPGYHALPNGVIAPREENPGALQILLLRQQKQIVYIEGIAAPALDTVRKELLQLAKTVKEF